MKSNNNKYKEGHRQRIFQKFLTENNNNLTNLEILEILLMLIIPRKNVKPIAYELINKYKNLYMVLNGEKEEIMKIEGVGCKTYRFFKIIFILIQFIQKEKIYNKQSFFNLDDIMSYCKWKMCFLTREELHILYLNSKNQLIKDEVNSYGSINSVSINNREIIKQCLNLGATSIILCHNHPSGDSSPSKEDINITINLQNLLNYLEIKLVDHIIIGGLNAFSMKKNNIL
jgi:DNA repair protein RadC